MVNFVTQKQAGTGLSVLDALGLSASKSLVVDGFVNNILGRFSQNPIINGAIKVAGAGALASVFKNKIGSLIATSMVISAGDDFFRPIVSSINGGSAGDNAGASRRSAGEDTFGQANVGRIRMRAI